MNIEEFHQKYFPNKHRNSTYRKITKIQDSLEKKGIIKVKETGKYIKRTVIRENELFEILKTVKII